MKTTWVLARARRAASTARVGVWLALCLVALAATPPTLAIEPDFDRAGAIAFLDAQWSKYFDLPAPEATFWESGFAPGGLWAMVRAEDAGLVDRGGAYLTNARRWSEALAPNYPIPPKTYVPGDHDVGFVYPLGFEAGAARFAGTPDGDAYADLLRGAADQLADRFDAGYGAVNSWNFYPSGTEPVIIDGMMTLRLLEWSALNEGPASHMEIALSHAAATIEHQLRVPTAYGSDTGRYAVHVMDMAAVPSGGDAIPGTHFFQARSPDSPWARGQAWGILGFARLYESSAGFADEATRAPLLAAAEDLADYFLEQTAEDAVPRWDFSVVTDPASSEYIPAEDIRDSSAGAIAAVGLLRLSRISEEPADRFRYHRAAERVLAAIAEDHFNLNAAADDPAILTDVVGYFAGGGIGTRTYADHYFTEATLAFAELIPGDADVDGRVDQADLNAVLNNWGAVMAADTPPELAWTRGDLDSSGAVEQGDLNAVLNHWGGSVAPDVWQVSVPEPTACLAFAFGLACCRSRR
ncbi:MAG: hypothetical protein AAF916_05710 [Planctomycetota bacterium]